MTRRQSLIVLILRGWVDVALSQSCQPLTNVSLDVQRQLIFFLKFDGMPINVALLRGTFLISTSVPHLSMICLFF
jgi:hypothetical protein